MNRVELAKIVYVLPIGFGNDSPIHHPSRRVEPCNTRWNQSAHKEVHHDEDAHESIETQFEDTFLVIPRDITDDSNREAVSINSSHSSEAFIYRTSDPSLGEACTVGQVHAFPSRKTTYASPVADKSIYSTLQRDTETDKQYRNVPSPI